MSYFIIYKYYVIMYKLITCSLSISIWKKETENNIMRASNLRKNNTRIDNLRIITKKL